MQIKNYIKGLANAVLNKSEGGMPLGLVWALQNIGFSWNVNYEKNYVNKIVYAVENIVVKKLVETPLIVSKVINKKTLRKFNKEIRPEYLHAFKELSLEEMPDHEIQALLDKPNDYQTRTEFLEAFWYNYNLGLYGGMIWAEMPGDDVRENRRGKPIALHVLPSNCVSVTTSNDFRNPISRVIFTTYQGQTIDINPQHIMFMRRWNPETNVESFSPQKAGSSIIARNDANSIAQGSAFVNGGTGILLSSDMGTDANGKSFNKISKEQMSQLKDTITKNIKGSYNNKNINFTNGYVNVQKLGDTLADLELIEAAKNDWKEYAAMRGVHPVLIGSEQASTESNVEMAYKVLVTNYVIPDLRKFDEKITAFMLNFYNEKDLVIKHDVTEFSELAPDLKLMKDTFGTPLLRVDEVRRLFNYDALGGNEGNAILVESGKQLLSDLMLGSLDDMNL